jgi:hypothetical protein
LENIYLAADDADLLCVLKKISVKSAKSVSSSVKMKTEGKFNIGK